MNNEKNTEQKIDNFIKETDAAASMGKTKKTVIAFCLIIVFIASFLCGYFIRYTSQSETVKLISELTKIIENNAKNTDNETELTQDELASKLVQAALAKDKYAKYYSPEEYKVLKAQSAGNYSGIGLSLYVGVLPDGTTYFTNIISTVIWNSPAEKAGLEKGDEITYGKKSDETEYMDLQEQNKLQQFFSDIKAGEEVNLKVKNKADVTIKKQQYVASYVKYIDNEQEMYFSSDEGSLIVDKKIDNTKGDSSLGNDVAYVKLVEFEGDAAQQFKIAMEHMKSRRRKKLLLDLRDNGGGSMSVLLDIASHLIYGNGDRINRIVYAEEKNRKVDFVTTENNYNTEIEKIAILANENTASASEALIGAMSFDSTRGGKFELANLVTTLNLKRHDYSTFGKGIMQTIYNLPNDGALKLTTAVLYQPDATTCIHDKGLVPSDSRNYMPNNAAAFNRAVEILST